MPFRTELILAGVLLALGCKDKQKPTPAPKPAPKLVDAAVQKTLEQELDSIRTKEKLPAVAAAAWRDGKLIEIAAVGVRSTGDPAKVTTKDLWHLGSNTKAMTATLVGIYVDRGVLHWDDPIGKYFPKANKGYVKVTLDQLLKHQGGAPAQPPDAIWKQLWADGAAPNAREKFVTAILAQPPAQAPGTFVYSNAGYVIAGAMLEHATKMKWEDVIRAELFGKLGMTSCGFGAPGRADVVDQPRGHDAGGTPIAPGPAADNPPGLGPAGTVHCSLEDYGKFLSLHATGQPALVKPETLAHLHDGANSYAGGWMVVHGQRGTLLMHAGSNTMWYAIAMVAPDQKLALAIVTNSGSDALERSIEPVVMRYPTKK